MLATLAVMALSQSPSTIPDLKQLLDMEYHSENGSFVVKDAVVAFPKPDAAYELVFSKDGQAIQSVKMTSEPFIAYDKFHCLTAQGDSIVRLPGAGSYQYALKANGQVVCAVDFAIDEQKSSDPFRREVVFGLKGPWSRYGVLLSNPARKDEAMTFDFWSFPGESGSSQGCQIVVTLMRGGKVAAQTRPYALSGNTWRAQSIPLWKPDNRFVFTQSDLTLVDGDFEVVVKHAGKTARTFKGRVEGKALKQMPQASTSYTPAKDILLPKTMLFSRPNKATLVDAYWMEGK